MNALRWPELIVPLRDYAREQVAMSKAPFVLVAHDWCKLSYPGHEFREDLAELSNDTDIGYELTTVAGHQCGAMELRWHRSKCT